MHLAAGSDDCLPHGFDYRRETVGADMRMRVDKDFGLCAMLVKCAQHTVDRAAFLAACICQSANCAITKIAKNSDTNTSKRMMSTISLLIVLMCCHISKLK